MTSETQRRASKNWRRRCVRDHMRKMIKDASIKLVLPTSVTRDALAILDTQEPWKGKSIYDITLAILYYAIHQSEDCPPITLKDFVYILKVRERVKRIWQAYKRIYWQQENKPEVCALRPTIYVRRYLAELNANEKVRKIALDLNERIVKEKLHMGKNPASVAVGIVYISFLLDGERDVTQRKIEEISSVNTVTIRNSYKRIVKGLGIKYMEAYRGFRS